MNISSFKIRALDRFILNELKAPFFFGLVAFTIILVAGGLLFQMAELIIQQGVSIGIVIRLFIYYMPRLVVFTIPMSCLLAALLGFGKLSANSEIVALKSAGLSFQRIVRPVVAAAFVISICALVINESIVPMSERAAANVMKYEVLHESAPVFKAKVFLKEEGGGAVERVIWLTDGAVYEIKETKEVGLLFKFNRQALMLNMAPDEISANDRKPDEMTIPELLRAIEIRGKTGAEAGDLWMAFHLRLAVPWACLIFGILGAALGSRPQRSSSSVGLGFSVIIIFVYYVIMSFGRALGESGSLPPLLAAWVANLVFLAISVFFCLRANRLG